MVGFVEQATLQLRDESSANLRKINREIRRVVRSARELDSLRINLKVDLDGIQQAEAAIKKLTFPRVTPIRAVLMGESEVEASLDRLTRHRVARITVDLEGDQHAHRMLSMLERHRDAVVDVDLVGAVQARQTIAAMARVTPAVSAVDITRVANEVQRLSGQLRLIDRLRPKVHLNSNELNTAIGRTERLISSLNRIPNTIPINVVYNTIGVPPVSGGGRGRGGDDGFDDSHEGQPERTRRPTPFSTALRNTFTYSITGLTVYAASNVIINAGRATLASQELTTSQNLTRSPLTNEIVNRYAAELLPTTIGLSETDLRLIGTDISGAIDSTTPEFRQIFEYAIRGLEAAAMIRPNSRETDERVLQRIINSAQISQDPERAQDLVQGFIRGLGAVGRDFNAEAFVKAFVQSATATTITGEGLTRMMLAFDAIGRQTGEDLARLSNILSREAGVSVRQQRMLQEAGLRTEEGEVIDPFLLAENPFAWLETYVVPNIVSRLREVNAALPIDDPRRISEDAPDLQFLNNEVAVRSLLEEMGFVTTELNTVASAIAGITEALIATKQAELVTMSPLEASAGDMNAALRNLTAGFETFSSRLLTPLFESTAPLVNNFGNLLKTVIDTGNGFSSLQVALAGLGTAVAGLLGARKIYNILSPNVIAVSANTAATERNTAALLATSGGGAPAAIGAGGGDQRRNGLRLGVLGGLTWAVAAYNATSEIYANWNEAPDQRRDRVLSELQSIRERNERLTSTVDSLAVRILGQRMADALFTTERERSAGEITPNGLELISDWFRRTLEVSEETNRQLITDGMASLNAQLAAGGVAAAGNIRGPAGMSNPPAPVLAELRPQEDRPLEVRLVEIPESSGPAGRYSLELERQLSGIQAQQGGGVTFQTADGISTTSPVVASMLESIRNFEITADESVTDMQTTFQTSATAMGVTIDESAQRFGPSVADAMLALAPSIGAAIGTAAAEQIRAATVNVRVPPTAAGAPRSSAPPIDTGGSGPF